MSFANSLALRMYRTRDGVRLLDCIILFVLGETNTKVCMLCTLRISVGTEL
jgi:hypothetical protein